MRYLISPELILLFTSQPLNRIKTNSIKIINIIFLRVNNGILHKGFNRANNRTNNKTNNNILIKCIIIKV